MIHAVAASFHKDRLQRFPKGWGHTIGVAKGGQSRLRSCLASLGTVPLLLRASLGTTFCQGSKVPYCFAAELRLCRFTCIIAGLEKLLYYGGFAGTARMRPRHRIDRFPGS